MRGSQKREEGHTAHVYAVRERREQGGEEEGGQQAQTETRSSEWKGQRVQIFVNEVVREERK